MRTEEYQLRAARTLLLEPPRDYSAEEIMLVWCAMGLSGEAGEVAEHVKKGVFHDHSVNRDKLIDELGDVLWYLSAVCTNQGIDLREVMERNNAKLQKRYDERGFTSEQSIERKDVE